MTLILREPSPPRFPQFRQRSVPTAVLSATAAVDSVIVAGETTAGTATRWYVREGSSGEWMPKAGATLSHTFSGLMEGTEYTFEAVAFDHEIPYPVDADGDRLANPSSDLDEFLEPYIVSVTARTSNVAPPAPSVTLTGGDTTVAIAANVPNGTAVTKWQWRIGTGSWTDVDNSAMVTLSHTLTGLTNGTAYAISVRAVNGSASGTETTASATPVGPVVPPAPTVTLSGAIDGEIRVAASVPAGTVLTAWEWRVGNNAWKSVPSTATSFAVTATGLNNGTEYTIGVRVLNMGALTAARGPITTATATPMASYVPPTAPTKPTLQATGGRRSATLTARTTGTVTKWQWRRADDATELADAAWNDFASTGTSVAIGVSNLGDDATWHFQVRAVNDDGTTVANSPISDAASAMTAASVPAKPTLDTEPGDTTIRLRATTAGPKVTGWQWKNGNGAWTTISGASGTSLNHVLTGLTNDQVYRISVRAVNGTTAGIPSNVSEATPTPRLFSGGGTNGDPYKLAVPLARFAAFQDITDFLRSATETAHGIQNVSMVIEITPEEYARWVVDLDFTHSQQDLDLYLFGRVRGTWTELDKSITTTDDEQVQRTFDELYVDRIRLLIVPSGGWDTGNPGGVTLCRLKIVATAQAGNRQVISLTTSQYEAGTTLRRWTRIQASVVSGLTSGTPAIVNQAEFGRVSNRDQFYMNVSSRLSAAFERSGTISISTAGKTLLVPMSNVTRISRGYTFQVRDDGLTAAEYSSIYDVLSNMQQGSSGTLILRDYDPLPAN